MYQFRAPVPWDDLVALGGDQPRKLCRQASAHHGTANVEDVPDVCCENQRFLLGELRLDFFAKSGAGFPKGPTTMRSR